MVRLASPHCRLRGDLMLIKQVLRLAGVFLALQAVSACSNSQVVTSVVVSPSEGGVGIQKALVKLRELREQAGAGLKQPLRLVLEPGEYLLTEPIKITPLDSGTPEAPTVIEARTPGTVVLAGAKGLPGQRLADQGRWRFVPPGTLDRVAERSGGQLFVNGKRAVLARQPNEGSEYFVDKALPAEGGGEASKDTFRAVAADAAALMPLLADDKDRAIVSVMQSWTSGDHRLGGLDASTGIAKVTPAAKWPFLMFGRSQRYVVRNLPKALDAPGEWVLSSGALQYVPRAEDAGNALEARWPRLPRLLMVDGDGALGHWVSHVQINGIGFEYTAETTPMTGFVDTQAAITVGAVIEVEGAQALSITKCSIKHTGGYGIWLRKAVGNSVISDCTMDDLGAGGIKVGSPETLRGPLAVEGNTIKHNVITNTGKDFPGAVGILVARSSGNQIVDNVIAHTSYTGISVGWQWGYGEPTAINNKVLNNVLFDIGQGQMSDLGGIYTLGRSPGTVISGNFIRQVEDYEAYGAGAWGIYNDEGTSEVLVKNNVVAGTHSGGYHLHYGRDNSVIGNLFSDAREAEIRWSDVEKSGAWRLEGNGVVPLNAKAKAFYVRGASALMKQSGNVVATGSGGALSVALGAQPADVVVSHAPKDVDEAWRSVVLHARSLTAGMSLGKQYVPRAIKPAQQHWGIDLDAVPLGGRPLEVRSFPQTPAGALAVVADGNDRCLQLTDGAPGMAKYDPHFYFTLDLSEGTVVSAFSVKLDRNAKLVHEWRDGQQPFNTGPSLMFSPAGLQVAGKVVAPLPLDAWIDVEVTQNISDKPNAWAAKIRPAGTSAWKKLGPFPIKGPAAPERIQWVGWYSDTEQVSVTCLKKMAIN